MSYHRTQRRISFAKLIIVLIILGCLSSSATMIWAVTLPIPDFEASFAEKQLSSSTKIYDRTGKVLLYDLRGDIKRTVISFAEMPEAIKKATIAIEDSEFYSHKGVEPSAIMRAFIVNTFSGGIRQGGSTITQQVIKNTILTKEKSLTRKIKEAILAIKLEKTMTKDQILELYLNESPYGGTIYGIEEASQSYFRKPASALTLAESAYLAALPQAPTYYSPYGKNKTQLDQRKNVVLKRMFDLNFITKDQYNNAVNEKVIFAPQEGRGIKAPHFVFMVKKYLDDKYGEENIKSKGYKVISTLDWEAQKNTEAVVKKYGEINEKSFRAKNESVVAIDPKTGQIIALVGSRDYFDTKNDGNFNIATAFRQPGSAFKPFVYATAFKKGYTPETVVFDLPTEFNTGCGPTGLPLGNTPATECYKPENFDGKFVGPISLRAALAQSRNIPAIKVLYLAGITDSIKTASDLGITSLKDKNRYGLTLVLGGGEVSLLEMTSAYSVFANDGVRNPYRSVLQVIGPDGKTLEEYKENSDRVLSENIARLINDILSDNEAKIPAYGENSPLFFPGRQVASKTGTTNDYRDTWTIGYTPSISVGAWVGNNDNSPMEKKVAGMIVAPMWHEVMLYFLAKQPAEQFISPQPINNDLKPILRGIWWGQNGTQDRSQAHSILYWIDKNNPLGPNPSSPGNDPQFRLWEYPIQLWANGIY